MSLAAGEKLGPYEILALIGAGGMGEVYRARDTKLKRDVALKVLPDAFARDPERMARFQREAELLASLNHPNIAHLYGIEDRALVMELVEGETLLCPLPVDTALSYAKQIADALEYAHERGVVHRDLKPANIKITPEGGVKVLDFGLAKAIDDPLPSADPSNSPTLTLGATRVGMILGTAAYMSPEQAAGKAADRRADIWSFGAVLYEMLAGKRAFGGESAADTLATVLKLDPDWDALPAATPASIRKLVRRCLTKDRKQRLQAIGEARIALENPGSDEPPVENPRRWLSWSVAAALTLALAALAYIHFRETPPAERVLHLSIPLPQGGTVGYLALSSDGRRLAMSVSVGSGASKLYLRSLDSPQFQTLSNGDFARTPFWSPDGRFIGFFEGGQLKTIPASGGPAQALCNAGLGGGAAWNRDGVILFATENPGPIMRVNASGGACTPVTRVPDTAHRLPEFLPDGKHFLYVALSSDESKRGVYLAALDDPNGRRILPDPSGVIYTPPPAGGRYSHLLFLRETTLMAQPFDDGAMQPAGDPFPVATDASFSFSAPQPAAAASANGILVYLANLSSQRQLVWLDRTGTEVGKVGTPAGQASVALSPDGKNAMIMHRDTDPRPGVWLHDLIRPSESPLIPDGRAAVWSPDSSHVAYTLRVKDLYVRDMAGGQELPLVHTANVKYASDWSRDGRFLLYTEIDPKTGADIWYLPNPLGKPGESKPEKFLATDKNESQAQFHPDGLWVAYVSNESGRNEVYVRPFPSGSRQPKVSINGGTDPRWSSDGRELYYTELAPPVSRLMAVTVHRAPGGALNLGPPQKLFEYRGLGIVPQANAFSYSPDRGGQRFLVNVNTERGEPTINVITNWQKAAVPMER